MTPASKRNAAGVMITEFRRSQRRACDLSSLRRSTCRYRSRRPGDDELRQKLREIALQRPAFGYRRLGYFLRKDGLRFNHKRLLRLYRSEGLGLPRKRPRKRLWQRPKPLLPAIHPNERWSIDFVADQLGSGRRFRIFTIMTTTRASGRRRSSTPRSAGRGSSGRSKSSPRLIRFRRPSSRTTGRSSRAERSCPGPRSAASSCASSSQASRIKTPSSKASMESCGSSV